MNDALIMNYYEMPCVVAYMKGDDGGLRVIMRTAKKYVAVLVYGPFKNRFSAIRVPLHLFHELLDSEEMQWAKNKESRSNEGFKELVEEQIYKDDLRKL